MKKKLSQSTSSFLSFYRAINPKNTLLYASVLMLSTIVNAATEKFVKATKTNSIEINSGLNTVAKATFFG